MLVCDFFFNFSKFFNSIFNLKKVVHVSSLQCVMWLC